jgi:hypothetical protein
VLIKAGQGPETLYSLPDPDQYNIASANISGHWLVVGIEIQGREPKNTIGGNTPDVIDAVVLVNMSTRATHVLIASPDYRHSPSLSGDGLTIVNDVVFDGKVYWDERASYSATTGEVKSYDLTTGKTETVFRGATSYLAAGAAGVVLDPQGIGKLVVRASLPPTVEAAMTDFARAHLNSDGQSYAWASDPNTIGWWRPGLAKPIYWRVPNGVDTDDGGGTPLVAGEFVDTFQPGATDMLTDMKTGASAPIADSAFAPYQRGQLIWGNGGAFAAEVLTNTTAHYVDEYWLDTPWGILTLDTASLPKLGC